MEQIDLKQLIEQYPEVLTDGTKLKAYILDLYPQCKRGMVNILVAIQQCGIVTEMQTSKNPSALDMSRWKKVLDDDYGFAGATAETCLQLWCSAVGIQLEIKASAETKPNKPNDNIPQKIEEKADGSHALQDSQNNQKDWFEYSGTTLLKLKEKYRDYKGEIHIPDSVTNIGVDAFRFCSSLTSVTIPNTVISIGDWAFSGCSSLVSITIPNSATSIGNGAFSSCSKLMGITIPNSVTSIGWAAFEYCSSLTSVVIPDGVTSICERLFNGCSSLTSVTIGKNVTSIDDGAFRGCVDLIHITIPDDVESIGQETFSGCVSLTSIMISNGVTSIGERAFYGCSNLTNITIGKSLTIIDSFAFANCSNLVSITVDSENPKYYGQGNCLVDSENKILAVGCKSSVIPNDGSVTSIGRTSFSGCTMLTSITIPSGVENIDDDAFSGCSGLMSIIVPDGVKSIGRGAFFNCTRLTNVTIPNSVTSIGGSAFSNCETLTGIDFLSVKGRWKAIEKGYGWNNDTGFYTVHCTNGDIPMNKSY